MRKEIEIQPFIDYANSILKSIIPDYSFPHLEYIKWMNAKSYWANIGKIAGKENVWGMHLSKLNFSLLKDKCNFNKRMQDCILHELIHTIPECNNHKEKFKSICSLITHKYPNLHPYKGENFVELKDEKSNSFSPKYLMKCSVCNYEYYYFRKPKYSIDNYMCKCGNKELKLFLA